MAVVELEREVTLGPKVGIVCLPTPNMQVASDQELIASGES